MDHMTICFEMLCKKTGMFLLKVTEVVWAPPQTKSNKQGHAPFSFRLMSVWFV